MIRYQVKARRLPQGPLRSVYVPAPCINIARARILSEAPTLATMEEAGETLLSKEEMEASGLEPDQVRRRISRKEIRIID